MSSVAITTLVIDTSVLPRRPEPLEVKEFLDNKIRVDWSVVGSVQLHNIRNFVLLGLKNETAAKQLASRHHLKHFISCMGKELPIPIPIYEKSRAVDVRVHDLDDEIGNEEVANYLRQFGEVMSMRDEVWKNFFPGVRNGVRVARMVIQKPIPTYATVRDQVTLISFKGQERECFRCGDKSHPKQKCHEVAMTKKSTKTSSTVLTPNDFPPLPASSSVTNQSTGQPQQTNKADNQDPSTSSSTAELEPPPPALVQQKGNEKIKRQRSAEEPAVRNKKTNTKDSNAATVNSESGYNAHLDFQLLFKEVWDSDLARHLAPEERKASLTEYAAKIIRLRKEDLEKERNVKK